MARRFIVVRRWTYRGRTHKEVSTPMSLKQARWHKRMSKGIKIVPHKKYYSKYRK